MFRPYHKFNDCKKLEKYCLELRDNGQLSDNIHESFIRHHYSLCHKLKSAQYHLESLENYIERQKTEENEPAEIVYRVNFHFDGFTYAIGSALDIFAREVLTYFGHSLSDNVYFQTAKEKISVSHPGNLILSKIAIPKWRKEFSDYRNTALHECVVGLSFSGNVEVIGGVAHKEISFPLPDDPRASHIAKTYNKNPDIVEYCCKTFKRTLTLINPAYCEICRQARIAGGFPI